MKLRRLLTLFVVVVATGCKTAPTPDIDKPQLTEDVRLIDESFHSAILSRDMEMRIIVPVKQIPGTRLPVVYLLHGAGVSYHDWTNNSQIASFAARGVVLVLPNMPGSYYLNQANGSNQRYETYFINELMPEVHRLVPNAANDRQHTALIGISRGGYGAAVLGLKHANMFGFVGLLSPAIDFAERGLRPHAPLESLGLRRVFGPIGGPTRTENDPFLLIQTVQPQSMPYFFIAAGDHEVLFTPTARFSSNLTANKLPHEFVIVPGAHNWGTWNGALPMLESSLWQYFCDPKSMRNITQ